MYFLLRLLGRWASWRMEWLVRFPARYPTVRCVLCEQGHARWVLLEVSRGTWSMKGDDIVVYASERG
jgi:hypothetical protein